MIRRLLRQLPPIRGRILITGPNSNTFLAHIGREVPALKLDLPANAVGKDFRSLLNPIGLPPSGRGVQVSVLGIAGVTLGLKRDLNSICWG